MIIGFNSIKSSLINSHKSQKLHHAILLNGKKGIGKASFAKDLAQTILGNKNETNPDLLIIEKIEKKQDIVVDQIREISNFVNKTSAFSPYKFIIIDSACELNKSSSNALLKILEEPHQNNFLILISHNLNKILPTIRSRCQIINSPNLSKLEFKQIIDEKNLVITDEDFKFLSQICDNSPAEVINIGTELSRFYALFLRSIHNKKISNELLKNVSDKNFEFAIFEKCFEFLLNKISKQINGIKLEYFFDEEKVFLDIISRISTEKIFLLAEKNLFLLRKTNSLYLDKKLNFINIFNQICYE